MSVVGKPRSTPMKVMESSVTLGKHGNWSVIASSSSSSSSGSGNRFLRNSSGYTVTVAGDR